MVCMAQSIYGPDEPSIHSLVNPQCALKEQLTTTADPPPSQICVKRHHFTRTCYSVYSRTTKYLIQSIYNLNTTPIPVVVHVCNRSGSLPEIFIYLPDRGYFSWVPGSEWIPRVMQLGFPASIQQGIQLTALSPTVLFCNTGNQDLHLTGQKLASILSSMCKPTKHFLFDALQPERCIKITLKNLPCL